MNEINGYKVIDNSCDVPERLWRRLDGAKNLWRDVIENRRGNTVSVNTASMGKVDFMIVPVIRTEETHTITVTVMCQWGYEIDDNWLLLVHGLNGYGYESVTAVRSSSRVWVFTACKTRKLNFVQLPIVLEFDPR